jgi:hypothetical protein
MRNLTLAGLAPTLKFIGLLLVAVFPAAAAHAQTGACCIGTACSLRTFSNCDSAGGDWLGPGTNCTGSPCGTPPGTCCNGTSCTLRTSSQCATAGGTFLGGTSCSPNPCSGSCCVNGNCSITALATCTSSGGAWLRFGSCSPNICPGPCCDNGACIVTVQSLCTGAGGVWTPGSACFPNPCGAPLCEFGITAITGGTTTAVARVGATGLLVARGTTLELFNAVNASSPAPFSPPRRLMLPAEAIEISTTPGSSRVFVLLTSGNTFHVTILTSPQLLFGESGLIGNEGVTDRSDIEADGDRVYIPYTTANIHGVYSSHVSIYECAAGGPAQRIATIEPTLQNSAVDRVTKVGNVLWLGMHLGGTSAYAVEGWDVSNPAAPVRRGSLAGFADVDDETEITGMQAIGNKVLVSFTNTGNGHDRLRAADVSNPSSPAWHPAVDVGGGVLCMAASGNHLRVGRGEAIQTWDTTNAASLTLLGTLNDSGVIPLRLSSGASTDYMAVGRYGLRTASFSNPAFPQIQSTLTPPASGAGLVRQIGTSTVMYDYEFDALRVFDYTLSEGQQLRGSVASLVQYADLMELTLVNSGSQRLACVGSSVTGMIRIFDVSTPTAPSVLSTISNAGVWRMSVSGSRLYAITSAAELKVYDLTNPASPALLSTTPYGGDRFDYTCITSWQNGPTRAVAIGTATFGLWLIDATNGASPQVVEVHSPVASYRVESLAKGPVFLYVSSSATFADSRLESLDVSSLGSPVVSYVTGPGLGAGEPGEFSSLGYLSVPTGRFLIGLRPSGQSVVLMDLTGPLGEGVVHRIFTASVPSSAQGFAVNPSGSVLLGTGSGGFQQLALPQSWAPGFSAPAPGDREVCLGGSTNPQSIAYQWFRAGTPAVALSNGPTAAGAVISGATTPTLTISNIHASQNGAFYFCTATNSCGSRNSANIRLALCIADFNCSGTVTVQDIFDFLAAYFSGNTLADVNASGAVSVQDIFDFLEAYFEGCP